MSEERLLHPGFYYTDFWTTEDQLHFSDFRQVLCDILMNAATPLTVGVFGPWGSGKTSLLKMLEQDIRDTAFTHYRPVWFTAWKYGQEEALWRAFILRVVDELYPHEQGKRIPFSELKSESQREQVAKLQRLEESVYRPVDWEELGRWTVDWWQALKGTGGAAAEIAMALLPGGGLVAEALKKMWSLVADGKASEEVSEAAAAVRREVQTYHREQLHSLEQFEAAFAEAMQLILGDEGRLIVFVDDLDRCLPEKAVEVLEAIKLFLEVPGTVFVIGMDRQVIERGIEARYGRLFRLEEAGEQRVPLPIRGDTYLQNALPLLEQRQRYTLLERLLSFPPADQAGEGEERARFAGLSREEMAVYVRLAGVVGAKVQAVEEAVAVVEEGLLELILSDDEVKVREGVERLREARDERLLTAVRQKVVARLEDPTESPKRRAAAGDALARLGDPRPGVGLREDGLPDILWCEVAAGPFIMGSEKAQDPRASDDESPQHEQSMPHSYRISKYPITNAQFGAFMRAGGYSEYGYWRAAKGASVWSNGQVKAWDDSKPRAAPYDFGAPFNLPNRPVVGVSWYEALAFCRWLDEELHQRSELSESEHVTLPTETEWEKAAWGTDGRRYPWGDELDPNRANYDETGIGTTSAVGIFPGGEAPYGCLDMSGNVLEWTRSLWGEDWTKSTFKYPYDPQDGREDVDAPKHVFRVLRGGAFQYSRGYVRCADRFGDYPVNFSNSFGFRVVVVPAF